MTTTRTKEERLASLNSRLEHAKARLNYEKKVQMRLQDDKRAAAGHEQMAATGKPPRDYWPQALGMATKALNDQITVVEALEAEINRIMDRIDEITEGK